MIAVLAFAPVAVAKESDGGGHVAAVSNAGPSASSGDNSSIPFTGLDAALLLSGGILLLGAGAAIARLVPRTEGI
jgi:hypothetical protein